MKFLILSLALSVPLPAESPTVKDVVVKMEVPSPAWKVKIESIHKKDGRLIIITRAIKEEGIFSQVVSETQAKAPLSSDIADIPRKTYILDADWNTSKGIESVSDDDLADILAGSTKLFQSPKEHTKDDFLGLSLPAAESMAKENKLLYRVVEVDGQPRPITLDFRMERFNFHVDNGVVSKVTKG